MTKITSSPTPSTPRTAPAAPASTPVASPPANVAVAKPARTDGFAGNVTNRAILGNDGSAAPVGLDTSGLPTNAPSLYALVPGRYPDAVGLDTMIANASRTPEGRAAVDQMLGGFEQKTGITIPQDVRTQVLEGTRSLTSVLAVTPQAMSDGAATLNLASKVKGQAAPKAPAYALPQHADLSKLASVPFTRETPAMKALVPGALYQGDLPSAASDAQVKANTLTAEIFDRLSANAGKPAAQQFSVAYGGKRYTRLDGFLGALKADGYQVTVTFQQRIANFADLKTPVPNTNPQQWADVPAPVFVKTGIKDASGNEAVVPACHSEMHINIQSGPNTKGPRLDAEVRFFQGIDGTGFFPNDSVASPAWCGSESSAPVTGDAAIHAAQLAGQLSQVINGAASRGHMADGGYGVTGVCNDSVAVVEQATTGQITEYPLLMKDSYVLGEINRMLPTAKGADAAGLRELATSIRAVPNDLTPNATQAQRALDSMPWTAGNEPFQSSVAARQILQNAGAKP